MGVVVGCKPNVCVWLSGWGCCFPSVRSTLHLLGPLSDRPTYITTPTPLFLSALPLHHPYSLSPSLHPSSSPPTLPLTCSHLSWVLVSLSAAHLSPVFSLSAARSLPYSPTPLARPPWVSFTSMMPHHYPCPTLSITQQLCHRARSCSVGRIPLKLWIKVWKQLDELSLLTEVVLGVKFIKQ